MCREGRHILSPTTIFAVNVDTYCRRRQYILSDNICCYFKVLGAPLEMNRSKVPIGFISLYIYNLWVFKFVRAVVLWLAECDIMAMLLGMHDESLKCLEHMDLTLDSASAYHY